VNPLLLIISETHHYILLASEFLLHSGQWTVCACIGSVSLFNVAYTSVSI